MKIHYDNETDSIYVQFSNDSIAESEEKSEGVVIDYNDKDEVIAVEILNVKSNPHDIDLPGILKNAS